VCVCVCLIGGEASADWVEYPCSSLVYLYKKRKIKLAAVHPSFLE
jgi:hypothetical protein